MSDKWMPMDEVIEHVMKAENCSRRTARRKVAKAAKDGKLRTRTVKLKKSPLKPLPKEEAAALIDEDPASVLFSLSDFIFLHGFPKEELLGELQSGRLVASASESTVFMLNTGVKANPADFTVDVMSLINWIGNSETPQHLIDKFNNSIERKLQ
jgi:hypothetical protein